MYSKLPQQKTQLVAVGGFGQLALIFCYCIIAGRIQQQLFINRLSYDTIYMNDNFRGE